MGKAFEKQIKTIEDQAEKQIKAIQDQGKLKAVQKIWSWYWMHSIYLETKRNI